MTRAPIVDVVLGVPRPEHWRGVWVAILIALGAHGALWLWALRSETSLEWLSAEMAARVHAELSRDEYVDLSNPPAPPPAPAISHAEEPANQPTPAKTHVTARSRVDSAKPPPPAQAGAIVAQETSPDAPVDLTGETFVTGTASAYAGGVTSARGTNTVAVTTRDVDPRSAPGTRTAKLDHSSTVSLQDQNWSCPWPSEADAEQIDEQTVVIRAVVRADGIAESAEVISDPGHGFGQAAVACALRTRFSHARARDGEAIRAQSPPIRVTFTR